MKITNPIVYIIIGGRIRYLAGAKSEQKIIGNNLIYDNLVWLESDIKDLGLKISENLLNRRLGKLKTEFEKLHNSEELDDAKNKLTAKQARDLVDNILIFEDTLYCEAQEQIIASPAPRRFTLDHLLNNPGDILGNGVFDKLTDIAQYDLEYSCKSIAFECPTAAAFHILRCIEECVRVLHKAYFPRKETDRPWGPLLQTLISKPKKPKPEETLLEHLNHLRKRFRNPTDHPEKIYEIEEVEDLVHLSVDVINRVIRDPKVHAQQ